MWNLGFDMVWKVFCWKSGWSGFGAFFSLPFRFSFWLFKDVFGFVVKGNRSFMWSWDIWNFHKVCRKIPIGWDHHPICFFLAPKHWRGSDETKPTSSYQRTLESQCSKDGDLICLLREDGQRRSGTYLHDEKLGYPTLTGVIRNTKNHQQSSRWHWTSCFCCASPAVGNIFPKS